MTHCHFWCILMAKEHHKASQIQEMWKETQFLDDRGYGYREVGDLGPFMQFSTAIYKPAWSNFLIPRLGKEGGFTLFFSLL